MMAKKENSLPKGWKNVRLGDFVHSAKGKKPKNHSKELTATCNIPYIDIDAFDRDNINSYTDGVGCVECKDTDFLMVWDGSRSGYVGKGMNGALGSTLVRLDFKDVFDKYAYYFLQSKYQLLNTRAKGSGTPHVDPHLLWNFELLIPPLEIQHRIVEKIETLFSELDNSVANLKAAKAQLKRYRQSVLNSAFEGKLTVAWREANGDKLETVEALMERIKAEREAAYETKLIEWHEAVISWENAGKEGKKPSKPKKLKEFQTLSINDLFALPKEWNWVYWNDILANDEGSFKRGPFGSSLTKSMFVSSGYKVYEQYCPINDDPSFARYYITDQKYNELKSFAVKAKDFLISCSGVTLGRITQIPDLFEEGIINQALLRVRHNHNIYSDDFFVYLFRSRYFQKMIFDNSTGSAIPNVKGVNELKSIPLPLMSIEEQRQIVNEIESRLSEADVMERTIDESLIKAEKMRQSILKKAFEGKLVTQKDIT